MSIITKPTVNKNETAVFTLSKSELALVQSVIDDPYFSEVTARYIRVRLYNDGRYGNGSFTELFNMKLFNVT